MEWEEAQYVESHTDIERIRTLATAVCRCEVALLDHLVLFSAIAQRRGMSSATAEEAREALLEDIGRQPGAWAKGLVVEFLLQHTLHTCSERRARWICAQWGVEYDALRKPPEPIMPRRRPGGAR